jgi:hypothetical protein
MVQRKKKQGGEPPLQTTGRSSSNPAASVRESSAKKEVQSAPPVQTKTSTSTETVERKVQSVPVQTKTLFTETVQQDIKPDITSGPAKNETPSSPEQKTSLPPIPEEAAVPVAPVQESPLPATPGDGLTDEDLTTITNVAKSRIYDTLKKNSVPDVTTINVTSYDAQIKNLLKSTFPGYAYPTNHTSPEAELLNNFAAFKYLSMYYNDNASASDDIKYEVVSTSVTFLNDVIKHLGTVRKSNAEPGKGVMGQIGDAFKGVFGKNKPSEEEPKSGGRY